MKLLAITVVNFDDYNQLHCVVVVTPKQHMNMWHIRIMRANQLNAEKCHLNLCVLYTLQTKKPKTKYTRYTVQKDDFSSHCILHTVGVTKIIDKVTTFSRTQNTFCTMFRAQKKKPTNRWIDKKNKQTNNTTTIANGLLKSIKTGSVPQFKSQLGLWDSCCFPFRRVQVIRLCFRASVPLHFPCAFN